MKNKRLFTYVFLFGLLVNGSACGSDHNETDFPETPGGETPSSPSGLQAYMLTTTDTRTYDLRESTVEFEPQASMSPKNILLNPQQIYQTMQGFGAALTGSSAFCLKLMKQEDRTAFLRRTYSLTEGYGCSYVRIAIGCSDFSLKEYTCCDTPGIENFALTSEETDYVIPILKEIIAINPDIRILGSPWTCPLWMKDYRKYPVYQNREYTAGQLKPEYYADYATYFVKWIQAFQAAGIPINAITIQNEPLNNKNSASLVMEWKEQRDFVKVLGPAFEAAGLSTKIYAYDHNYNYDNKSDQNGYPYQIYNDSEAAKYIAGAAYHDYGGNRSELLNVYQRAPEKDLIFTESSIGTWNNGHDLTKTLLSNMESIGIGTINNYCSAVTIWNLMLETDFNGSIPSNNGGQPNRPGGCQTCFGAVDLNMSDLKTIYMNSHHYMICHLSAVVRPGAIRIGTSGYTDNDIAYSAFKNTDGSYAFVIINKSSSDKNIVLTAPDDAGKKHSASCTLQPRSVNSFKWK